MAFCPVFGVIAGSYVSMWLDSPEMFIPGELFALGGFIWGIWLATKVGDFFNLNTWQDD